MKAQVSETEKVEAFIAAQTPAIQALLTEMRKTIREAAPDAIERIAYGMPSFWQKGYIAHYAPAKAHLGFYPTPAAIEAFADELTSYKTSKGAVQLPFDAPLPKDLIQRMVRFNLEKNSIKK